MKETYWGYWLILLGVFVIGVMLLVNNISTTNTNDYYNIKEVTQASMIDAIDYSYFRLYGNIKISEQKFVENFIRRFADNANGANTYRVEFYDLYEVPPKVSVKISTNTRKFNIGNSAQNDYEVVNTISSILELGLKGADYPDDGGSKEKVTDCKLYISTSLLEFLKGEVANKDGKYWNDVKSSFNDSATLENLAKSSTDIQDFKAKFKRQYTSVASATKYNDLPKDIRTFIDYGYITLSR